MDTCGQARPPIDENKDSERRQRAAIEGFAKSAGYRIVDWYRDPAVSGADPVPEGFIAVEPLTGV
jgi:hypothetical protein